MPVRSATRWAWLVSNCGSPRSAANRDNALQSISGLRRVAGPARSTKRYRGASPRQTCLTHSCPCCPACGVGQCLTAKSDDVPNASPIEGLQQRVDWEPLGVVGLICAWNFPVLMSCDHAVPALALGCCVVHKPSEVRRGRSRARARPELGTPSPLTTQRIGCAVQFATMTARRLAAVFWEAGIPKEAYQIVEGGGRAGAEFAACRLGALEFIGSFSTGAAVARAAAPNHTRLGLELGGNDAFLVRADADVASCSRELAGAAFYASGQNCNGVKRVYVACEILDEFVAAFVAVARAFKVGLPDDEDTFVGPLTRGRAAVEILNHQVAASVACGARVVLGGEEALPRELSSDSYFPPTVLVDCPPHAPVMCEESFGPLVGIAAVASDEEAVSLMNDSKFGLTAGVFSKDRAASALLMAQLDVGSVYFNTAGLVEPGLPWAGRKASGVGSILGGAAGLRRSFCKSKSVYFAP